MTRARAPNHESFVQRWLAERVGGGREEDASPEDALRLWAIALKKIWTRSCAILGEATLRAIVHRVVVSTHSEHPVVARVVECEPLSGEPLVLVKERIDRNGSSVVAELFRGVTFMLTQLLCVLGGLTGESMTASLYLELSSIPPRRCALDDSRDEQLVGHTSQVAWRDAAS